MSFRIIVIGALCAALAGCGAQIAAMSGIPIVAPTDASAVSANIKVERNSYTGSTTVSGPIIFADDNVFGNAYLVRSWIDPDNPALNDHFQIYIMGTFNDWRFLSQAYASGHPLDTTLIGREVGSCSSYGCTVHETVGVNLSREEVKKLMKTGLGLQVQGKRGSVTVFVPGAYFTAVLAAHDKAKGARA